MRLGVLVSGSGSNLQALIERVHGRAATIAGVCSSNAEAFALERARAAGIESAVFALAGARGDARRATARWRTGWTRAASSSSSAPGSWAARRAAFLARFPARMLNLHPSLLPAFPGRARDRGRAARHGVRETGVTVHLVDEVLDGGPDRRPGAPCPVDYDETPEGLRARIHAVEHRLLPAVVEDVVRGAARSRRHRQEGPHVTVKRALISVSDKTGLLELRARASSSSASS